MRRRQTDRQTDRWMDGDFTCQPDCRPRSNARNESTSSSGCLHILMKSQRHVLMKFDLLHQTFVDVGHIHNMIARHGLTTPGKYNCFISRYYLTVYIIFSNSACSCKHTQLIFFTARRVCIARTRYDTIRYDSVYLTCSKKLTGSQLSLLHGINKK